MLGWAFPCLTFQPEISWALRCAHRPTLLKAFPAKHRPPLRGTEGNCRFLPALRAVGPGFRARRAGVTATASFGPFCFAGFTSLGFVFETLVGEKHLFAGSEHELRPAIRTLQH